MNGRERFKTVLSKGIPDRIPITELSFWPETISRWEREGMWEGVSPADYFGMDQIFLQCPFDGSLRLPERVIEEKETYKIESNSDGVVLKSFKHSYAPPVETDFQIKTREDWERLKTRLLDLENRFTENSMESYELAVRQGNFRVITPVEPVWYIIRTLGFARALEAMALEPGFVDDMLSSYTDFTIKMLNKTVRGGMTYDALWFFADLCYKNGMLFSPLMYREKFMECHKKIKSFCAENDMSLILHCDGDVREFIPLIIQSGFDCIQPLEARAGNDVRELKEIYGGKICFFGNINMDVLAEGGKQEIEMEVVSKITAAKKNGGYIYHSDHSVPPTVSLENYSFAVELAKRYGGY